MTDRVGHVRPDHEDCECAEELDHDLYVCSCPGYLFEQGRTAALLSKRQRDA